MDFQITYLSFYVMEVKDEDKRYKHYQTLDTEMYEKSALQDFLDGELSKIAKRKVDRHSKSEGAPTKIGRFITEEGYELDSNPNYNVFQNARNAETKEGFQTASEKLAQMYVETSAIRGGVMLVVSARLRKYFDDPFLFIIKCDFEPKVASIRDEQTLIQHVEMAITTKNMKSIQYPYMPEEGMMDEAEVKVHQASHSRYFEDFLSFVAFEKSMPEIVRSQVVDIVHEHVEETYPEESEEKEQFVSMVEEWSQTSEREIQERWTNEQVIEASQQITDTAPEVELKLKLDHIQIKSLLADYGDCLHLAKVNGKYVMLIEAEQVIFDKGFSPIEFLQPDELDQVVEKLKSSNN